jgi:hypothetical protein
MRVAILSDIHADLQALERVLDAVDRARADEVWCLGDIVGLGGSEPAAVIELVRERATVALAGNHDRWRRCPTTSLLWIGPPCLPREGGVGAPIARDATRSKSRCRHRAGSWPAGVRGGHVGGSQQPSGPAWPFVHRRVHASPLRGRDEQCATVLAA